MGKRPISIRGHHLLCMLGFRGLGYSEEFIQNMSRIVDYIMGTPQTLIKLTVKCDAICSACPFQKDGGCVKSGNEEERVKNIDADVLSRIGTSSDSVTTAAEAFRRIASRVGVDDLEKHFCPKCEWLDRGFCVHGLNELKERMLNER